MSEASETAREALRILRRIRTSFADAPQKYGVGFVGAEAGTVITCAHVITEPGIKLTGVLVEPIPKFLVSTS